MSDPFWPMMGAGVVLTAVLLGSYFTIEHYRPGTLDESKWPCERFANRALMDVPARCAKGFVKR